MGTTGNAVKILNREIGDDPELRRMVAEEMVNARVVQATYDLRTEAGLTQRELARRVGTTQPVIAHLEDADYQGHSLRMLIRIASVLGRELDVHFVDSRRTRTKHSRASTPAE